MALEPPPRLARALGETHGERADAWLGRLSRIAADAVARRGFTVERVVAPGGRGCLTLLGLHTDGRPAALRIAPPFAPPDAAHTALLHWKGWGAVETYDPEPAPDGTLLLERLRPEVSLRSLPDAKALLEAAGTARRLWVAPPEGHVFETVAERTARDAAAMRAYAGADGAVASLVGAALDVRTELCADPPEPVLLHGEFRQGKVLAGDRAPWLAVGPRPLVGEQAYDLARLARDRIEDLVGSEAGPSAARRRVHRLADSLDVDRERLLGWTLFRAVEAGTRALAAGRTGAGEVLLEFGAWL